MKKQNQFKNSSRLNTSFQSSYRQMDYASNRFPKDSWTDMRIQQIKKKYETPTSNYQRKYNLSNQLADSKSTQISMLRHRRNYESRTGSREFSQNYLNSSYEENIPSFGVDANDDAFKKIQVKSKNTNSFHEPSKIKRHQTYANEQRDFDNYDYKRANRFQGNIKHVNRETLAQIKNQQAQWTQKTDPRVQNIDRINQKIKRILDCLHDHENYKEEHLIKHQNLSNKKLFKNSYLIKDSEVVSGGQHEDELEETKILTRKQICGDDSKKDDRNLYKRSVNQSPQIAFKIFGSRASENKKAWGQDLKKSINATEKSHGDIGSEKKYGVEKQKKNDFQWFENNRISANRSKSCLGGFKHEQDFEMRLSSGKKVDDEIGKLNDRIKKFEEEKKKLNIEFKPFNVELKNTRSTSNLNSKSFQASKPPLPKPRTSDLGCNSTRIESLNKKYNRTKTENSESQIGQNKNNMTRCESSSNIQRIMNKYKNKPSMIEKKELGTRQEKDLEPEKVLFRNPSFQRDLNDMNEEQKQDSSQSKVTIPQENKSSKINKQFEDKAYEGIENRKQKLLNIQTATATFARETKRFIQSLFQQVKIDEELRNSKIWFRDFFFQQDKWVHLQKLAKQRKLKVGNFKNEFEITQQEDNPFYSVRQNPSNNSLESLIENWKKADTFWNKNIVHSYSLKEFQHEKFSLDKIDLEKKGYFSVEDLVRFLNMETGTFYRNRDLILIFRRFTKDSTLNWNQFIELLNQNNQLQSIKRQNFDNKGSSRKFGGNSQQKKDQNSNQVEAETHTD